MSLMAGTNWRSFSSYLVDDHRGCALRTRDPEDSAAIWSRRSFDVAGPGKHRPLDRGQRPGRWASP